MLKIKYIFKANLVEIRSIKSKNKVNKVGKIRSINSKNKVEKKTCPAFKLFLEIVLF